MAEMMKITDWVEHIATLYQKSIGAFFLASSAGAAGYISLTHKFCGPAIPESFAAEDLIASLKENGTTFDFKEYHYVEREGMVLLQSESDFLIVRTCSEEECMIGAVCAENMVDRASSILEVCAELLKE